MSKCCKKLRSWKGTTTPDSYGTPKESIRKRETLWAVSELWCKAVSLFEGEYVSLFLILFTKDLFLVTTRPVPSPCPGVRLRALPFSPLTAIAIQCKVTVISDVALLQHFISLFVPTYVLGTRVVWWCVQVCILFPRVSFSTFTWSFEASHFNQVQRDLCVTYGKASRERSCRPGKTKCTASK